MTFKDHRLNTEKGNHSGKDEEHEIVKGEFCSRTDAVNDFGHQESALDAVVEPLDLLLHLDQLAITLGLLHLGFGLVVIVGHFIILLKYSLIICALG